MHTKPPNILLISTDQHRADHLGCYGAQVLSTPHIDALASRGTRYENAYVASPVCMPNRASIATGRMPSVHGVRHNGLNLDIASQTFASVLHRAGYRTSLSGKPHFQCITQNPAPMRRNRPSGAISEAVLRTSGRYTQESGPLWRDGRASTVDTPYYGFDGVDLAIGHGDDVSGDYLSWVKAQGGNLADLAGPENALPCIHPAAPQAWRTAVPEELYATRYVQAKTISRLRDHARSGTPFCHWMSFGDPHHPFTPPGRYWDMYRPEDVELPRSFRATQDGFSSALQSLRDSGNANLCGTSAIAVNEAELRSALALTYGMVAMIDDAVGTVLGQLEVLGLAANTVVIFTADHGDLMGDHGLIFKGPFHFRGLIRTPLIWSDPRFPEPRVCADPISAIDIPATILAAAGAVPFNGFQGRPFKQSDGSDAQARDNVLIEDETQFSLPDRDVRSRVRTLLADGWRLTIYDGREEGCLFNINEDPDELHNLWNEPSVAGTRAHMTETLLRQMIAHTETSPLPDFAA